MSETSQRRKPAAFRLGGGDDIAFDSDEFEPPVPVVGPVAAPSSGFGWGKLFLGALGALASFAIGVWAVDFVQSLFSREGWLGWVGLAIAALVAIGAAGFVLREVLGLARLSKLKKLRDLAAVARTSSDTARELTYALDRLYAPRAELATARAELATHRGEVIDPGDRVDLAERILLARLDADAQRLIADAARRVSVVTAVSPAALVDIGFVAFSHLGLIRRLAQLYGGRPGFLAMLRLGRAVVTHIAVTGGVALGDGIIQQVLGHGLAARLSARLGEGVLHGILATRIGIAAMEVARPLPFVALPKPSVTELAGAIARPVKRQVEMESAAKGT